MSDNNNLYELRKKLMEMQNALMKNLDGKPADEPAPPVQSAAHTAPQPPVQPPQPPVQHITPQTDISFNSSDVMSMFKELYTNQQKILRLLIEINSKLK